MTEQHLSADKANAAHFVSQVLSDVLGWSRYPDPKSLTGEWWDANKQGVSKVVYSAMQAFDDDPVTCQKLTHARKLSFEFLALLYHSPELAAVKASEWKVGRDLDLYNELGKLAQFFGAWEVDLPSGEKPDINTWALTRGQNSKITISDQMMVLFKNDDSILDRKALSDEVAKILGCSASAVRHPTNSTWKFYQTEQARRKKLRQELKGKRWTDSEQNDAVN